MERRVALITNVSEYAGSPAAAALSSEGFAVLCHDKSFAEAKARKEFEAAHEGLGAASASTPEDLVRETMERFGRIDALISNDAYPAKRTRIEEGVADAYRETIEALMVAPYRLAAAAAKPMKAQGGGRMVFVTSASPFRPYPGFSMYASARAGASALAQALAKELGPAGIQVNAVAPNFLYSETYYPRAQWMEDPKYVQRLKDMVPMQRLGRPDEIGALIAFLASGKSDFVTGQVIGFTGGWP